MTAFGVSTLSRLFTIRKLSANRAKRDLANLGIVQFVVTCYSTRRGITSSLTYSAKGVGMRTQFALTLRVQKLLPSLRHDAKVETNRGCHAFQ